MWVFWFFAKNYGFLILNVCSFALMQKNQKIKTENSTKLLNNFLKFPNLHGNIIGSSLQNLSRASNNGNLTPFLFNYRIVEALCAFLTEIIQKFLTSPFSKSVCVNLTKIYFHTRWQRVDNILVLNMKI